MFLVHLFTPITGLPPGKGGTEPTTEGMRNMNATNVGSNQTIGLSCILTLLVKKTLVESFAAPDFHPLRNVVWVDSGGVHRFSVG